MEQQNYFITGILIICLSLLVFGCETSLEGDLNENMPPSTNLTLNEINRTGEQRLSSQINISWWGDDPDGFLSGFEVAIDDTLGNDAWTFTTRNDSTFILPITEGADTADVEFFVRAVDNDGLKDPEPASLVFPIKNSTPEVQLVRNAILPEKKQVPPDSTFRIASFGWSLSDEDGIANIATTEIALNRPEGEWLEIPSEETFLTLRAQSLEGSVTEASIFFGSSFRSTDITLNELRLDSDNRFHVRVTDQAGAVSQQDTVSWYVKRQTSNILFIHDDASNSGDQNVQFHKDKLGENGLVVDTWDISGGTAERGQSVNLSESFPAVIEPTLQRTLAEWDHIYWLSNSLNRNINFAQEITGLFRENGGNMFVNIPMTNIDDDSPLLDFLAIDRQGTLPSLGTGFSIGFNSDIRPTDNLDGAPVMKTQQAITGISPFVPAAGADALYEADFLVRLVTGGSREFEDFGNIAVKSQEGNVLYVGMDFRNINGNDNISEVLERLLIDELGFNR